MWARRFRNAPIRMARQDGDLSWNVGFEYEYADPISRDYECPLCLHVMREPTVTDCCGGHFCSSCILTVSGSGKGCPLCRRHSFKTLINKTVERKIADLRICCTMKELGCPWQGTARDVVAHLERETGDCGFVSVNCPAKCGQEALRSQIPVHLRDHCPKREVVCPHCRHKAAADQMAAEHWVACPNRCMGEDDSVRFERCRLELHLSECPNQPVPCDFRDLGCDERIRRQDTFEHNTSKHLVMLYTLMMNMKKRLEAKDATIRQLEGSLLKEGQERERIEKELKQKCAEMAALNEGGANIRPQNHVSVLNPSQLVHVMPRFAFYKTTQEWWEGPEFYTHHEGYKLRLRACIRPEVDSVSKSSSSCVRVRIDVLEGRYDKELKWGRRFKVAVGLLNQLTDDRHFVKTLEGALVQFRAAGVEENTLIEDSHFVSSDELEHTKEAPVQFVRDDCIKFRICSVEFQ